MRKRWNIFSHSLCLLFLFSLLGFFLHVEMLNNTKRWTTSENNMWKKRRSEGSFHVFERNFLFLFSFSSSTSSSIIPLNDEISKFILLASLSLFFSVVVCKFLLLCRWKNMRSEATYSTIKEEEIGNFRKFSIFQPSRCWAGLLLYLKRRFNCSLGWKLFMTRRISKFFCCTSKWVSEHYIAAKVLRCYDKVSDIKAATSSWHLWHYFVLSSTRISCNLSNRCSTINTHSRKCSSLISPEKRCQHTNILIALQTSIKMKRCCLLAWKDEELSFSLKF